MKYSDWSQIGLMKSFSLCQFSTNFHQAQAYEYTNKNFNFFEVKVEIFVWDIPELVPDMMEFLKIHALIWISELGSISNHLENHGFTYVLFSEFYKLDFWFKKKRLLWNVYLCQKKNVLRSKNQAFA